MGVYKPGWKRTQKHMEDDFRIPEFLNLARLTRTERICCMDSRTLAVAYQATTDRGPDLVSAAWMLDRVTLPRIYCMDSCMEARLTLGLVFTTWMLDRDPAENLLHG